MKRPQLPSAVTARITSHQPIKQIGSVHVRLLKPVQYLTLHPLEGVRTGVSRVGIC